MKVKVMIRGRQVACRVWLGEVIPCYYDQPERWREMMAGSIAATAEPFSTDRTLYEYDELMYQERATACEP